MKSSREWLLIENEEISKVWAMAQSDFKRLGRWGTSKGETEKEQLFRKEKNQQRYIGSHLKKIFKEGMIDQ